MDILYLKDAVTTMTNSLYTADEYHDPKTGRRFDYAVRKLHFLECLSDFLLGVEECRIFTQTGKQLIASQLILEKHDPIKPESQETLNYDEE